MESNLCQNSGSGSIIFELIAKPFIHFWVNHITLCPTKGLNYCMGDIDVIKYISCT